MQINGKTIEWKHLRDLYHKFHSMAMQSAGLSLVPKLKMEHTELTSFSQMWVDLFAQVSTNLHMYVDEHQLELKLCMHVCMFSHFLPIKHAHVINCYMHVHAQMKSVADGFVYFGDASTTETFGILIASVSICEAFLEIKGET